MGKYIIAVIMIASALGAGSVYCQVGHAASGGDDIQDKDLAAFAKGEEKKLEQDEERISEDNKRIEEDDNEAFQNSLMEQKAKDRAARIEGNGTLL